MQHLDDHELGPFGRNREHRKEPVIEATIPDSVAEIDPAAFGVSCAATPA